jgi:predicted GTPase
LVLDQASGASYRKLFPFYEQLQDWREKMVGLEHGVQNQGFWNLREEAVPDELPAMRILVCGNTGVGKSELINKVFGVEVTKVIYPPLSLQ